jgi:uncharacterized protein
VTQRSSSVIQEEEKMAHAISWFEIPANNLDRAMKFYGALLEADLQKMDMGTSVMAFLPTSQDEIGGAIVHVQDKSWGYKPDHSGSIVYLNGGDDLSAPLSRVEAAGGKVLKPKTDIGQGFGYFAFFEDTEGNRVGLHSMK